MATAAAPGGDNGVAGGLGGPGDVNAQGSTGASDKPHFLYRVVLTRVKHPEREPKVLTADEVERLLARLPGVTWLMASRLYGSGLHLSEVPRLRVKDVDFGCRQIIVRDGKGYKDRVTMLPAPLVEPLKQQIARVRTILSTCA